MESRLSESGPAGIASKRASRPPESSWPSIAVLLLFTALLLWPLLVGRALYWGDMALYFEPMFTFSRQHLTAGHVPLWNPFVLCGQPFLGNPQMAVFYPDSLLIALLPVWIYVSVSTVLHVFLCGAFSFLYLRRWTVHQTSAAAGALVYMGSACLVGRIQFPPMIQSAPFLPLLLYFVDRYVDSPRPRLSAGITCAVALLVLAGHAQMAYMSLAAATAYCLVRTIARSGGVAARARARQRTLRIVVIGAAAALGLALAAVQILPAVQLIRSSTREALTPALANRFVLKPVQLLTLIDPHFVGHPATSDYSAGGNAWEPAIFVGWAPLALIAYAVARCARERLVRFWAVTAVIGLWLALGNLGGLYWICFYIVPGVASFHDPARFLLFTTFGFCVLTAAGFDALRERAKFFSAGAGRWAMVAIAAPLILFGREWNPTTSPAKLDSAKSAGLQKFDSGTPARIYMPEHSLYWRRFVTDGYVDYGIESVRSPNDMQRTLVPNLPMTRGIPMAAGYEPIPISAVAGLDGLARTAFQRGEPNLDAILYIMDIGTVGNPAYRHSVDPGLTPASRMDGRMSAAESRALSLCSATGMAPERAWLARSARHVEGKMRISAALTSPEFDPREEAVVSGGGAYTLTRLNGAPGESADAAGQLRLLLLTETRCRWSVKCGSAPGHFVYASTAYPGWVGRVDGRPAAPIRTDGAFLGLRLAPGTHTVSLEYRPFTIRLGTFISLAAAAIAAGIYLPFAVVRFALVREARRVAVHAGR